MHHGMGWDKISQGYTDILIGNMEFYDKSLRGLGEYCILFSAQISQAFINQFSRQIPLLYSNDFIVLLHEFNSAKPAIESRKILMTACFAMSCM